MRFSVLSFALLFACVAPKSETLLDAPPFQPAENLRSAFDAAGESAGKGGVRLLPDNADAWATRWALIEDARVRIDVSYFLIEPDVFGRSLLGLLLRKALEGVQVRLMMDSRGSAFLSHSNIARDVLEQLVATGNVQVRVYNPIELRLLDVVRTLNFSPIVASNHDKMVLVDGQAAVIGGRNIAAHYFASPADHLEAFVDLDVLLTAPDAVLDLERAFTREFVGARIGTLQKDLVNIGDPSASLRLNALVMSTWLHDPTDCAPLCDDLALRLEGQVMSLEDVVPDKLLRNVLRAASEELAPHKALRGALAAPQPDPARTAEIRILDSRSNMMDGGQSNAINVHLANLLLTVEDELIMQSPYLVISPTGVSLLRALSDRGADITLITNGPRTSDGVLTQTVFLRDYAELLAAVPRLRLFVVGGDRFLHTKAGVFDEKVAFVGSYNLDHLSASVNGEIVASIWSTEVAHELRQILVAPLEAGAEEYRIERDDTGAVVRHPKGHVDAGQPVVLSGPTEHEDDVKEVRETLRFLEDTGMMWLLEPFL